MKTEDIGKLLDLEIGATLEIHNENGTTLVTRKDQDTFIFKGEESEAHCFVKMVDEATAAYLYTVYCQEVGGVAFNGDPLPAWAEFSADPNKQKQVNAWRAVGRLAAKCGRQTVK